MQTKVWVVALALAAVVLAGCAEDSNPEENVDETFQDFELEATEETGIIRGVVVDSAIVPIEGAAIVIEETGAVSTTNANGAFGFSELEPGTYLLTAERAGFGTVQQRATVEAGVAEPDVLKILMERDPSTAPYVESTSFNGFVACSFTLGVLSLAACGLPVVEDQLGHVFLEEHSFNRAPEWVQSEMVWEPSQTGGSWMSISWTDPGTNGQRRISAESGASPLTTSWDREVFEEMNLTGLTLWLRVFSTAQDGTDVFEEESWNQPYRDAVYPMINGTPVATGPFGENCIKYPALFDSCLNWGGLGATISQDYEMFTSAFFNFTPREGWSFVEDGPHDLPE